MNQLISVCEYEKIYIGKRRNIANKQISERDANFLVQIVGNHLPIFTRRNNTISAEQWIGVIDLPGLSIEILPKIAGQYNRQTLLDIILRMLELSEDVLFSKHSIEGSLQSGFSGIKDILIFSFVQSLDKYIREGLLRDYTKIEKVTPKIKGQMKTSDRTIFVSKYPTTFKCRFSVFSYNSKINQVIFCALSNMCKNERKYRKILSPFLAFFENVDQLPGDVALSQIVEKNLITERVYKLYSLARLYLTGEILNFNHGNQEASVFLFDMNRLFENFVFSILKRKLGKKVHYQSSKYYLVSSANFNQVRLRPDILVEMEGEKIVIDTKWKMITKLPAEADLYQMNAYSTSIPDCNITCLLYPDSFNNSGTTDLYVINSINPRKKYILVFKIKMHEILEDNVFEKVFAPLWNIIIDLKNTI